MFEQKENHSDRIPTEQCSELIRLIDRYGFKIHLILVEWYLTVAMVPNEMSNRRIMPKDRNNEIVNWKSLRTRTGRGSILARKENI